MKRRESGTKISASRKTERIAGLDGLRGVAALVVLIHHSLLLSRSFIEPYRNPRPESFGDMQWWLTYTPLHLFWDGSIAVFIFFVLSGFVLCLPARTRPMDWLAYYPSRIVRLYLPVWGAVVLALFWIFAVPSRTIGSDWLEGHQPPTAGGILRDVLLVLGQAGQTNSALWSLRWEVIFSVALPLFVLFAATTRRFAGAKVTFLLLLLTIGAYLGPADRPYSADALFQLPIFALGCLLAFEWNRVLAITRSFGATFPNSFVWISVAAALLLSSYWLIYAMPIATVIQDAAAPATRVLQVVGAIMTVILAAASPRLSALLSARPVHWLGTRSFSLYLVHEPMVVALGHLIGEPVNPLVTLAITVPSALILAEVFFRVVELPSHRLSQAISGKLKQRNGRIARRPLEPGHLADVGIPASNPSPPE